MIAIALRFAAGRYHATPWGRHVNEGAVEWPPSPWRILRALVATWKRTLPDLPQAKVEPVLRALCELPEFVVPPASTGHTRHYMPWDKGWKPNKPHPKTLVFDAFVALSRNVPIWICWPNASLNQDQAEILGRILTNLNKLGRSESWCEAALEQDVAIPQGYENLVRSCVPLRDGVLPPDREIVRLLCPNPESAFADNYVVTVKTKKTGRGENRQTVEQRSTVYDPAWNICMETLQLHKERWSDPPGSRWVQYARPRDCFRTQTIRRCTNIERKTPLIQIARLALDSTVLPLVTETLPVAEAARRTLMGSYGRRNMTADGEKGRSSVFSGKDERSNPLSGHGHAYYLPTDEDNDGRLDHLTVIARDGFSLAECQTLDQLRQLKTGRSGEESHPLRLLLIGMGKLADYSPGPLQTSTTWISATPYVATRYAKTRGRDKIDLNSPQARATFLINDLRGQIKSAWPVIEIERVKIEAVIDEHGVFRIAKHWRPIQFKRYRRKGSDDGGRRLAGAFRVVFPVEVQGPIAFGHSCHFGLGLFASTESS